MNGWPDLDKWVGAPPARPKECYLTGRPAERVIAAGRALIPISDAGLALLAAESLRLEYRRLAAWRPRP